MESWLKVSSDQLIKNIVGNRSTPITGSRLKIIEPNFYSDYGGMTDQQDEQTKDTKLSLSPNI